MRKVYSAILVLFLSFLITTPAGTVEDSPSSRTTLKGLPGVRIGVSKQSGCEFAGVHAQAIGAEVDSQLQEAGIKVLEKGQGSVVLRVIFVCTPLPRTDAVLYFSIVRVDQTIPWPNSSNEAIVTTWRGEQGVGISHREKASGDLRKDIKARVNRFIGAWLSVNGE